MKVLKRSLIGIILVPFVLIALFILYEIVGMAVNHISSSQQTKKLINIIDTEFSSVKIIDTYTETGNTTGTSNHVDMLSVVTFTTETPLSEIQNKLGEYYERDEFWIENMGESENGYLVYLRQAAPFWDNIEGH